MTIQVRKTRRDILQALNNSLNKFRLVQNSNVNWSSCYSLRLWKQSWLPYKAIRISKICCWKSEDW